MSLLIDCLELCICLAMSTVLCFMQINLFVLLYYIIQIHLSLQKRANPNSAATITNSGLATNFQVYIHKVLFFFFFFFFFLLLLFFVVVVVFRDWCSLTYIVIHTSTLVDIPFHSYLEIISDPTQICGCSWKLCCRIPCEAYQLIN